MQLNKEEYIKSVGLRIKWHRNNLKLTQLDLAINSDMEENAIQRIEQGRTNPTVKTLIKIALALNIQMCQLFPYFDPHQTEE